MSGHRVLDESLLLFEMRLLVLAAKRSLEVVLLGEGGLDVLYDVLDGLLLVAFEGDLLCVEQVRDGDEVPVHVEVLLRVPILVLVLLLLCERLRDPIA